MFQHRRNIWTFPIFQHRNCQKFIHYFSNCIDALLQVNREKYAGHIKKKGERVSLFKNTIIAMYALMFHDHTVIAGTAKYVNQIMIIFDLLATD